MTFEEAKQIAEVEIKQQRFSNNDSLIIIDEGIVEKEYAWIFPYTSKKYRETKDMNYAIGGNGPLFVSKLDGQISIYRTGLSLDVMIEEHEEKNNLWMLSLVDTLDSNSFLVLKKILNWTQGQLIEFRKDSYKVIDKGSKTRLTQIQSSLDSAHIMTTLILDKSYHLSANR
ncbi:MAG: YrhB domain-containing protein [Cyclobacteriaceae bacterium]|nr:YrhB domain-containing protein [Cyclobacteriaceae bacterium]